MQSSNGQPTPSSSSQSPDSPSFSSLPPLSRSELWFGNRRYALPCLSIDFDGGEMLVAVGHPAQSRSELTLHTFTDCESLWEFLAQVAQDAREERRRYDEQAEADRLRRRAELADFPIIAVDGLDLGIDL